MKSGHIPHIRLVTTEFEDMEGCAVTDSGLNMDREVVT